MSEFLCSIFHIPTALRYIRAVIKKLIQSVHGNHPLIAWNDFKNRKLVKINLPFLLRLLGKGSKNAEVISYSNNSYQLLVFWDVSIIELNSVLYQPWEDISNAINSGTLLHGFCAHRGPAIRYPSHNDKVIKITRPPVPVGLGPLSSDRYPLIVFQVRDLLAKAKAKEYVALITIINGPDENSTAMAIQAQYIKQANGEVTCLEKMNLLYSGPVDGASIARFEAIQAMQAIQRHIEELEGRNLFQDYVSIVGFKAIERLIVESEHHSTLRQDHLFFLRLIAIEILIKELEHPNVYLPARHSIRRLKTIQSIERIIVKLEGESLSQGEALLSPPESENTLGPHRPDLPNDNTIQGHICIVCKDAPINYGFRPCNHACICKVCFYNVTSCPLCRGPMESYFYYKDQLCPGSYLLETSGVSQKVWGFLSALFGYKKEIYSSRISLHPYILHCEP